MPRRTVGKRLAKSAPRGETVAYCDGCGALWHRSKLRASMDGKLYCPEEGTGLNEYELGLIEQRNTVRPQRIYRQMVPGRYYKPT